MDTISLLGAFVFNDMGEYNKEFTYIQVGFWMRKLDLSGNDLLLFGLIYGFSQSKENWFTGSLNYIMEWLSVSKSTAMRSLEKLVDLGYIEKQSFTQNNIKYNRYRVNETVVSKCYHCIQNETEGGVKMKKGGVKMIPNNTINNNTINNNIGESNKNIAPPQSLFEGTDFDKKKKSLFKNCKAFDFEYFEKQFDDDSFKNVDLSYYFHQVNDWSLQKNQMRTLEGWIATARTWMRNDLKAGKLQQKKNGSGMRAEDLEYLRMTNGDFN